MQQDNSSKKYEMERTCATCKNKQIHLLAKLEAAFDLIDPQLVFESKCPNCSTTSFTDYTDKPQPDRHLFKEWALNDDYRFFPMDEDISLASINYFDILLELIDAEDTLPSKRVILIESLCLLVYDNSEEDGEKEVRDKVILELNKRIVYLKQAEEQMFSYIKKVVFPQLNFEN